MPCHRTKDLMAGMVIAEDVQDRMGRLLIPNGTPLTEKHLRALKLWGVAMVRVAGEETEDPSAAQSAVTPEMVEAARVEALTLYRHNLALRNEPVFRELLKQSILRIARGPKCAQSADESGESPRAKAKEPRLTLDQLIARTETLASLPEIYNQIVEVVYHPRSSSSDLANVISADTGLTARLLRIVNSAFYGFPAKIETVTRAITVVGTNELCELALATSIMTMFDEALRGRVDMRKFWCHSLCCGAMSRCLARRRREPNPERHFVTGLLHDLGRLVLLDKSPQAAAEAMAAAERDIKPLYLAERDTIGYSHTAVGRALLDRWNLPESQREAVFYHHVPQAAKRYPMEAAIVHVAEIAAHALRLGSSGDILVPPLTLSAWQRLELSAEVLGACMEEAALQVNDLVTIFGLDKHS